LVIIKKQISHTVEIFKCCIGDSEGHSLKRWRSYIQVGDIFLSPDEQFFNNEAKKEVLIKKGQ